MLVCKNLDLNHLYRAHKIVKIVIYCCVLELNPTFKDENMQRIECEEIVLCANFSTMNLSLHIVATELR